jgi:isopentenyl diphosphate isomerase/L-lactate dehydrogenase-like FMN-dependent dehydrogenase
MQHRPTPLESRRALLRFLAASPLAAGLGLTLDLDNALAQSDALLDAATLPDDPAPRGNPALPRDPALLSAPADAVDVFDLEAHVKKTLPVGHYTYMAYGSDDSAMLEINRQGLEHIKLKPRRLVDTSSLDTSIELFGHRYSMPIFLAPCGAQAAFHPEGEVAVARAAKSKNALQVLSTVANFSIEEVARARGAPLWFQLYPSSSWGVTEPMIKRAERAGCTALALTVDIPARNMEESERMHRNTNPACLPCHEPNPDLAFNAMAMFDGLDMRGVRFGVAGLTWDYLDRLREATSMKLLVKGIVTAEDAARCLDRGVDAIWVSNHGGRADVTGMASVESLVDVLSVARGRVPVIVDSGFRRGRDVFKALALGADAVCIGRPYLWGLGAFGTAGVERVLEILERELRIVMTQMGTVDLAGITRDYLKV